MMRKALFLFFFSIGLVSQAQDSEPKLVSGISWGYIIPQENLDVVYDHGFAFIGNFDYRFNKNLIGRFDIGWNDLSGPETQYIDTAGVVHTNHPNRSILEITAGLRAAYSYFYRRCCRASNEELPCLKIKSIRGRKSASPEKNRLGFWENFGFYRRRRTQ